MPYPRSNAAIALHLLAKFLGLIHSISFKMGARYYLSNEDRQDLIHAAKAKIATTKWRTVLKRGGNRPLENYVISTIQTTMSKELRRIKAGGLSGLSKGPKIGEFPQHESDTQRTSMLLPLRKTAAAWPTILDKMAAEEITDRARRLLHPIEWFVISRIYGLDDEDVQTTEGIADTLDLPVLDVEVILERSLKKLR